MSRPQSGAFDSKTTILPTISPATMGPAHYKDLGEVYTKRMEVHGLGFALFHPIAAQDMRPPCCGYFDRNGQWNLICNLLPALDPPLYPPCYELGYAPLEYVPLKSSDLNIEWQPKTALGTQEHVIAASAETPDTEPGGASAEVKYTSNAKFGAVLMTQKPITLTAFNDERLFRCWLEDNRGQLYDLHGSELKRYGMWLVTRTYTCRGCSINVWSDNNKASVLSTKAKAAMLGELGEDLNWTDRLASRDWSHYHSASKEGVVVFMDGIDMTPLEWRLEGFRQKVPGTKARDRSLSRHRQQDVRKRRASAGASGDAIPAMAIISDAADGNGQRRGSPARSSPHSSPPSAASPALKAIQATDTLQLHAPRRRSLSQGRRSRQDAQTENKRITWYSDGVDEKMLQDVGLSPSLSLSRGVSPHSISPSPRLTASGVARSPSLRRETRSISREQ